MLSLDTALPSKQGKYLITHLHAWSIAMEHAKNYEVRCKLQNYLKYTNKTTGIFSGQCNLQFLSKVVLQRV